MSELFERVLREARSKYVTKDEYEVGDKVMVKGRTGKVLIKDEYKDKFLVQDDVYREWYVPKTDVLGLEYTSVIRNQERAAKRLENS